MLKTLSTLANDARANLLAEAAGFFMPTPDTTAAHEPSPVLAALIKELGEKAKVDPRDSSPASRSAILQVLVSELSQLLLVQDRVSEVKARLGDSGELPSKQYRVAFDPSFDASLKRGVRKSHVEDALQSPDAVQHLPESGSPIESRVSLYTKRVEGSRNSPDPFIFLVHSRRSGDVQHIVTAWRVYPGDVPLKEATRPLDILAAFIEVYGLEFTVSTDTSRQKLIVGRQLSGIPDQAESQILKLDAPGVAFETSQTIRRIHNVAFEIALAYAVNVSRYLVDLRHHRVEIDESFWAKKSQTMHVGVAHDPVAQAVEDKVKEQERLRQRS